MENNTQSHATGTTGTIAALPSPDPLGNGVPIPLREGETALPDARWTLPGRSRGQPQRLETRRAIDRDYGSGTLPSRHFEVA